MTGSPTPRSVPACPACGWTTPGGIGYRPTCTGGRLEQPEPTIEDLRAEVERLTAEVAALKECNGIMGRQLQDRDEAWRVADERARGLDR